MISYITLPQDLRCEDAIRIAYICKKDLSVYKTCMICYRTSNGTTRARIVPDLAQEHMGYNIQKYN